MALVKSLTDLMPTSGEVTPETQPAGTEAPKPGEGLGGALFPWNNPFNTGQPEGAPAPLPGMVAPRGAFRQSIFDVDKPLPPGMTAEQLAQAELERLQASGQPIPSQSQQVQRPTGLPAESKAPVPTPISGPGGGAPDATLLMQAGQNTAYAQFLQQYAAGMQANVGALGQVASKLQTTQPGPPPSQPSSGTGSIESVTPAPTISGGYLPSINGYERVAVDRIRQMTYDGRNVFAFTVKDGDVQSWDSHNGSPPAERAELRYAPGASSQKANSPYNAVPGERTGYALSMNFDQNFPDSQKWATMLQFHEPDSTGNLVFPGIAINGNMLIIRKPGSTERLWQAPLQKGMWYDFQLDINWQPNSSGFVRVWLNGQQIIDWSGPTIAPNSYAYVKQGYYRSGTVQQTGTVYQTQLQMFDGGLPR